MTMMGNKPIPPRDIPDSFLEAVRVMRDVDQGLHGMETELRYALGLQDLDPRLRDEMQFVQDSLGAVKISLSIMDMTASRVLSDLGRPESLTRRLEPGGCEWRGATSER
jgi:hypothetical protein